jgi:hypothetical protein
MPLAVDTVVAVMYTQWYLCCSALMQEYSSDICDDNSSGSSSSSSSNTQHGKLQQRCNHTFAEEQAVRRAVKLKQAFYWKLLSVQTSTLSQDACLLSAH